MNVDWFFVSHRLPIAKVMQKKGYEIHIACNFSSKKNYFNSLGFKTHDLNIDRKSFSLLDAFTNILEIKKIIEIISPDIVHFISIKPILFGGLALKLLRRKPYSVFSVSGLGHVFIANSLFGKIKRYLVSLLYRISLSHKNICVIFQNKDDQKLIIKISKINYAKTVIIPGSGIILEDFSYSKLPSNPVVLFPARLLISKGILEFIKCAKVLKDQARFVISGQFDEDNPDCISKEELFKWVKSDVVEYWGFSENMSYTFSKCSIVVLPSYREGFPKVLMEASACGRPIITTDVPGCRDAIIPNINGLLVKVKDHTELSIAVKKMLSNDFNLNKMSLASRKLAVEKFSIDIVINAHYKIYSEVN